MSAAPLKLLILVLEQEEVLRLRTLMSAAPLKRRSSSWNLLISPESPHSHECGPVEAKYVLQQSNDVLIVSALS